MRPTLTKAKKLAKKPRLIHFSAKVDRFIEMEARKPGKTLKSVIEERILLCMRFTQFPPPDSLFLPSAGRSATQNGGKSTP